MSGFDSRWLDILICPVTRTQLEPVSLPRSVCEELEKRYRESFRDAEPIVEQGLYAPEAGLVYPIVSGIPILLSEEALPAAVLERSSAPPDE